MKITIPKPCHENWDSMTPEEKGRFCAVCSTVVRDFSNCSDEEVYCELKSNSNICGRFNEGQMKKNLGLSVLGKFALGLMISGSAGLFNAQSVSGKDVEKVDFKKGFEGMRVVNDTIGLSHWKGRPSKKDIESTQPVIYLDGKKNF